MRLIDADVLKAVICASKCGIIDPKMCECGCVDILCIDNAPTIDDSITKFIEETWCKNCGHYDEKECEAHCMLNDIRKKINQQTEVTT